MGITSNLQIMKLIKYKIIKNSVCESITKEILKHHCDSMYVCSVNTWMIRPGVELRGAWFLEVAQHQLVVTYSIAVLLNAVHYSYHKG